MAMNILGGARHTELKAAFYDAVKMINAAHWQKVTAGKNIYLSLEYLQALEEAMEGSMKFRYILFYDKNSEPVAVASVQLLNFVDREAKYHSLLCRMSEHIKNQLLRSLGIKVMICGNVFATGENGFMFTDAVSGEEAYHNLSHALQRLRQSEKINGQVSIVLLKDFWPSSFSKSDALKTHDFRDFMIDVNMVLKIQSGWKSFEDYLNSLTAKFRTRAKSVFKKSEEIRVENLDEAGIEKYKSEIETLYNNVREKADFKFGALNGDAFILFKRNLGDMFRLTGYFHDHALVGFSSAVISNEVVDGNYVGLDYNLNQQFALYQRMLYDFVELAIQSSAFELRLGRTAEEIKSCIGAEPTHMKLYMKHRSAVSNKLLKPIIASIVPREFELRKPFRTVVA
jgi:predicted N-acyltransferase